MRWQDDFVLCSITEFELFYGATNADDSKNEEIKVLDFIRRFECVPFGRHAASLAGELRTNLEAIGKMIGPFDLFIAAMAIIRGERLITHNTAEFSRVPHLEWEDWQ